MSATRPVEVRVGVAHGTTAVVVSSGLKLRVGPYQLRANPQSRETVSFWSRSDSQASAPRDRHS